MRPLKDNPLRPCMLHPGLMRAAGLSDLARGCGAVTRSLNSSYGNCTVPLTAQISLTRVNAISPPPVNVV